MNRSQAITRLTSIIDIRNEQIARLKEIQKEIKNIIKMGDKADEKLLALDQDKNVQEIFPRSLQEAMVEYNANPLTNDTIYDFLSDSDSDFRQLNVKKTLSKVLDYAEDETDDLPEHSEDEEEDEDE